MKHLKMNKRIIASTIDFIIYILICLILLSNYKDIDLMYLPKKVYLIVTLCAILPLFKDIIFKNASIGKKIMKLEVLNKDYRKPTLIQLILRNITFIIWPIEIILVLTINKRIGDIIFKTEVYDKNRKYKTSIISLESKRAIALIVDFMLIIMFTLIPYVIILKLTDRKFESTFEFIVLIWFILLIFKDIVFKNASVGKKIMNIEIKKQNKKPHLIIVILRNITIIVAAIEIILTIVGNKRLGDIIFNTDVVESN